MATGFSVMDALNKNSKAGVDESPRARFRTKDISIFKMYRNKLNFYDLADIEELAGDILMYGDEIMRGYDKRQLQTES